MSPRRLVILSLCLIVGSLAALVYAPNPAQIVPESLPARLSDAEYWRIVTEFSEPSGFFRSDNFVSNESTFQHVIPELQAASRRGGVYLGVGPDQNFTYIAALQPKMAFIVDIRRQNMMLHLIYKAIFELSEDRAQFLTRLFSRSLPDDLPADAPPARLFSALATGPADTDLMNQNLLEILDRLQQHHKFFLNGEDVRTIEYVYRAFVSEGPEIKYSSPSTFNMRRFPSYSDLMKEADEAGRNHSYLATEDNFRILKRLQTENRLLPLVGNFAGDDALRAVGRYLNDHGAKVTAFYTSNVEFYLFQSDDWKRFYSNVAELPLDDNSTFIRAVFSNRDWRPIRSPSSARSTTYLDNIPELVDDFRRGRIDNYGDLTSRAR